MAAGAVVSVSMGVMKPVLAKLTILMGDEYKKLKGLQKHVTFLQHELSEMDTLLESMDNTDELNPQAKKWRKYIIEMSYNIEDRIDDFMNSVGEADEKMGILQKASQYVRTFNDRRRLANEFHDIKTQVIEASKRRKRYMLDQCISINNPIVVDPRMSALYKESASLVGIKAQKDELINWAMEEVQQLNLMTIVGLGGLGKTTLANEVYREVREKFECMAFISVSQKPEIVGIFNSLLKQLGLKEDKELSDAINTLRGHLQDKRYFIVVDDLWDIRAWNAIKCAFPPSNHCSRVIITTRNQDVARSCCHDHHGYIHNMKHLSELDSSKLFFGRIFGSEESCPTEFKKASCEILKKCGGLPLAIITMASMLACQPTKLEGQWDYIQNSLATKSTTSSNYEDMMYILDLSYKNLPRHLKACFLYLGSYPEDHEIDRDDLVRQWVAEGFVGNSTMQDVWDVAESYFNELVNRSMIQPIYDEYMITVLSCRVHDMLLHLILRKCKEDNFLHLVNDLKAVEEVKDEIVHRFNFVGLSGTDDHTNLTRTTSRNLSQIRSLIIVRVCNWTPPLQEFKFLRVLVLRRLIPKIKMDQTCINQLSQLRYLKIGSGVVLPCKIQGLRLLETLDLFFKLDNDKDEYTLEIVDIPHLSHLILPALCTSRLLGRIGELKLLRTLHGISLPMDSLETTIALGELTAMSSLVFDLPIECVPSAKATWMAALSASLEKLSNLKVLTVRFNRVAWSGDALFGSLPPFRKLENLDMSGCTFSRVPSWIGHLQNLSKLSLGVKQMVQEDFAIIGTGAPSLLSLTLRIVGILTERIVIRGSTGFACVRVFEFNCDCISYLSFEAGAMPELGELKLVFDANEWDKAAPGGLQHLPQLKKIEAQRSCYDTAEWRRRDRAFNDKDANKAEEERIRGVFQKAADALPTCPTFFLEPSSWRHRPVEEEEEEEEEEDEP